MSKTTRDIDLGNVFENSFALLNKNRNIIYPLLIWNVLNLLLLAFYMQFSGVTALTHELGSLGEDPAEDFDWSSYRYLLSPTNIAMGVIFLLLSAISWYLLMSVSLLLIYGSINKVNVHKTLYKDAWRYACKIFWRDMLLSVLFIVLFTLVGLFVVLLGFISPILLILGLIIGSMGLLAMFLFVNTKYFVFV